MKTQIIVLSLICTSFLMAENFVNPLSVEMKSIENGGTIPAIDAYSDGVGVVVQDYKSPVNNSAMNSLVFIYGKEAKANGVSLPDQVLLSGTQADIEKASIFFVDGATCDDKNAGTAGETYLNGVCQGGTVLHPDGESCTDNNIMTINDIYTNGICAGILTVNGQTCNDENSLTTNDVYNNGVCQGIILPPYNNSCTGGYSGIMSESISCSTRGLTSLSSGYLNLTGMSAGNLDFDSNYLTNVDNLSNVKTLANVFLNRNNLSNINGLRNLETVTGVFYLYYSSYSGQSNANLTDLSPLNNLTFLGGQIRITQENLMLTAISVHIQI